MSTYYGVKDHQQYLNEEHSFKGKDYEKEAEYYRMCNQKCPICGLYASFITNVHCVKEHNMTKKEVEAIHGKIRAGGR